MSIAIVTDSTSDLEPDVARNLGIAVVPLFVRFGDRSYRDYLDLSRADFYRKFAAEKDLPNTSQPTAVMFEEAFGPHARSGDTVLCLTLSSKLSGTLNAARSAAQQFPGATIALVDSESIAGGLQMQVLASHALAQAGKPLDEILAYLAKQRAKQRLYACIADLSHLVRTGRIGKAKAALGTLMKVVPVLSLREGEVVAEAQVRTPKRGREAMIDLAVKSVNGAAKARFLIMHTNAPHIAAEVQSQLAGRIEGSGAQIAGVVETGPVIATHVGPGAVGIFCAQG